MNVIPPETRMMGLPYGEEIMIVGRTMWTQSTSVTDGRTDRRTELRSRRPCNAERGTVKTGTAPVRLCITFRPMIYFYKNVGFCTFEPQPPARPHSNDQALLTMPRSTTRHHCTAGRNIVRPMRPHSTTVLSPIHTADATKLFCRVGGVNTIRS